MTTAAAIVEAEWHVCTPQEGHQHKASINEESNVGDGGKVGTYDNEAHPQHTAEQKNDPLTSEILNRLDEARILGTDDKILLAAHLLHGIDDRFLQPVHYRILKEAAIFKDLLRDNTTPLDHSNEKRGWIKQGQHTGRHNFTIHYKMEKSSAGQELHCRLGTVIHPDLLVPFLSVLNESELYATWLPNYTVPKLKVAKSEKLRQSGRVSQVIDVETEIQWPMATRQLILKAVACDNIDSYAEDEKEGHVSECLGKDGGRILLRLQSLDCENSQEEGLEILPAKKGVCRIIMQGGFTFEKCPSDHPMAKFALEYDAKSAIPKSVKCEDLILITFSFKVDPHLAIIPKSFINFFMRTAIGQMWSMFLNIAEDVKEGKCPAHSEAIAKKREVLYDWVEERTRVMCQAPQLT